MDIIKAARAITVFLSAHAHASTFFFFFFSLAHLNL